MKNYKKYQPDTQEINTVELPTPDAVADILAAEILTNVNEHGRVINRKILRKSIIDGLAKLALVTIAADDDTEDMQGAPVSLEVIRDEVLAAVGKKFDVDGNPEDPDLINLRPDVEYAIKAIFDYYLR